MQAENALEQLPIVLLIGTSGHGRSWNLPIYRGHDRLIRERCHVKIYQFCKRRIDRKGN